MSDHHPALRTRFAGSRPTPTIASLTLHEANGSTEIELTQGPFATEARRDLHQAGWADSLARLASHLAPT